MEVKLFKTKPLSTNPVAAFFQKIWRWWLAVWYTFSENHPKLAKVLYTVGFFVLFSQAVTIFQFVLFLFLPHLFGQDLASITWYLPHNWVMGTKTYDGAIVTLAEDTWINGIKYAEGTRYEFAEWTQRFNIFFLGKPVQFQQINIKPMDYMGIEGVTSIIINEKVVGGGLGYFYAFLIATFLAQCINFPLQRNITFRSKGNPVYQALWYFIGWLLIQPFCDFIGSLWKGVVGLYLGSSWPVFLVVLLDTIIMGGVAMAIFYFVFLVIFPDLEKVAMNKDAKAKKLLETLNRIKETEDTAKIEKAEAAYEKARFEADKAIKISNINIANKMIFAIDSTTNSKMVQSNALVTAYNKRVSASKRIDKTRNTDEIARIKGEIDDLKDKMLRVYGEAQKAIEDKARITAEQTEVINQNQQELNAMQEIQPAPAN